MGELVPSGQGAGNRRGGGKVGCYVKSKACPCPCPQGHVMSVQGGRYAWETSSMSAMSGVG